MECFWRFSCLPFETLTHTRRPKNDSIVSRHVFLCCFGLQHAHLGFHIFSSSGLYTFLVCIFDCICFVFLFFFSRVHATLQPALSIGRSGGLILLFLWFFFTPLLLPKWASDLKYSPCPPARAFGSRVSGLVFILLVIALHGRQRL